MLNLLRNEEVCRRVLALASEASTKEDVGWAFRRLLDDMSVGFIQDAEETGVLFKVAWNAIGKLLPSLQIESDDLDFVVEETVGEYECEGWSSTNQTMLKRLRGVFACSPIHSCKDS